MHEFRVKLSALRKKRTLAANALDKQMVDAEIDQLLKLAVEVCRERELTFFYPLKGYALL